MTYFEEKLPQEIIAFIRENFDLSPDYLFSTPDIAVFRHQSGKWFAVLMNIPYRKLGLNRDGNADIINLKCPPELISLLIDGQTYFRGYHMNKEHWLTVLLDENITLDELAPLILQSHSLTNIKQKRTARP